MEFESGIVPFSNSNSGLQLFPIPQFPIKRQNLVRLAKRNMAAESARNGRRIYLKIVHRLKNVPHEPDPRTAQVVEDACDGAPLANFIGGGSGGQGSARPTIGHGRAARPFAAVFT